MTGGSVASMAMSSHSQYQQHQRRFRTASLVPMPCPKALKPGRAKRRPFHTGYCGQAYINTLCCTQTWMHCQRLAWAPHGLLKTTVHASIALQVLSSFKRTERPIPACLLTACLAYTQAFVHAGRRTVQQARVSLKASPSRRQYMSRMMAVTTS